MKYPLPDVTMKPDPVAAMQRRSRRDKPFRRGELIVPPLTTAQRQAVLDRDFNPEVNGWVCPYCAVVVTCLSGVQVDHIVARRGKWRRGGNTPSNLITCCKPCNLSKGNKPVDSWLSARAR